MAFRAKVEPTEKSNLEAFFYFCKTVQLPTEKISGKIDG